MKFFFFKPKKKKYLIFDRNGSEILRKYVLRKRKKLIEIMDIRYESINIYVLIYTLLKNLSFFKTKAFIKNLKNYYIVNYIKLVSPKVVLTYIDNNLLFYRLKDHYPYAKYISFQNAMRGSRFFLDLKNYAKKYKLKCDFLFVFGENLKKKISNLIDAKIFAFGNILNNYLLKKKKVFKKSILYIGSRELQEIDIFFLNILKRFCIKNNIQLFILLKSPKFVRSSRGVSRLPQDKKNEIIKKLNFKKIIFTNIEKKYIAINSAELIVFSSSTLGYEAFSKNKKIICLYYKKKLFKRPYLKFGFPGNYKAKGKFWSNSQNKDEIFKMISKIYFMKEKKWNDICKKYRNLFSFDKKNNKSRALIHKIEKLAS